MSPEVFSVVLGAAFIHALWNAALRGGADPLRVRALMVLASSVVGSLALFFLPAPAPAAWPFILASVTLHLGYNVLLVRMYRLGDLSHSYAICRSTQPLLVSLGGIVLAGEQPTPPTLTGILLVSVGIGTLAFSRSLRPAAVGAALLTGACIAAYTTVDGLGGRLSGHFASYTIWIVTLNGFPMLAVYALSRKTLRLWPRSPADWLTGVGGGLLSTAGYCLIIWALSRAPMGIVATLRETSILFAILLGWLWFRERLTPQKFLAAALILAGLFFLHSG